MLRAMTLSRVLVAIAIFGAAVARAEEHVIPVYVAPTEADSAGDGALARWALDSWQRAAGGAFRLVPSPEKRALLRLYWVGGGRPGGFGEMRPIFVDGRSGAAVFVNTDMDALGPEIANRARADRLYRDTIVYLTCVHEIGHGLGEEHTAEYADIMYSFRYGGDIPGYFARYRRRLQTRADFARNDAFSDGDLAQLKRLHFR
jgi:hypothetical protein